MKERLDYIDRARGILIILMVIGHIWQSGFVFDTIYAFHMPAFFVISGFLLHITQSYKNPFQSFFLSRLFSFGIPLLFGEFLGIITDIMRNGVTLNIKGYVYTTISLTYNNKNIWFLLVLFCIEMMFAAAMRFLKKDRQMWLLGIVLYLSRYILPVGNGYMSTLSDIFKYYIFFLMGYYGYTLFLKRKNAAVCVCTVILLIYVAFNQEIKPNNFLIQNLVYIFIASCGTYITLWLSKCNFKEPINHFLEYSGQNSIVILCTHRIYYAALGLMLGVKDFKVTPIGKGILILVTVFLLEIPTIYVINRWLPFLAGKRKKKTKTA